MFGDLESDRATVLGTGFDIALWLLTLMYRLNEGPFGLYRSASLR
ncbi:MAG: hypothetical protein AAGI27_11765 [Pseudomonadota bacterium]